MSKNEHAPSAAQLAAWRALWAVLLAPRTPSDDKVNKAQKSEPPDSDDKRQP